MDRSWIFVGLHGIEESDLLSFCDERDVRLASRLNACTYVRTDSCTDARTHSSASSCTRTCAMKLKF